MKQFTGLIIDECMAAVDRAMKTNPAPEMAGEISQILGERPTAQAQAEPCCDADPPLSWIRCDWAEHDASLRFVRIVPPVFCPRGGQVTIEATGETAILRVFTADFEQLETRLHCAVIRQGDEVHIVSGQVCS